MLCVAASFALHVAAFIAFPGFVRERTPPGVPVLDVVLVRPEVTPETLPEPPLLQPSASRDSSRRQEESKPKVKTPGSPAGRMDEVPETASAQPPVSSEREPFAESALISQQPPFESPRGAAVKPEGQVPSREPVATTPPAFNATYLRNPPPPYPLVARRNGEQGTVTLRVLVTREGAPASVSVEKTSGSGHLDRAALETVKSWRFVPALRGAEPIEAWVLVPIVFRLEGRS
jgi:protein TonB